MVSATKPGVGQLLDQRLDRAPVEPHPGGQFGTGQLTVNMDLTHQRADVEPPNLVLRRSRSVFVSVSTLASS